ncbi:bacteriohopanetetrol glucosamine biosynthesis glycosyltransferase HpnI [Rhodoplanes sp. TEM]|uniref:Bacteriohopanetetrol glucosamine biosynthesis glycosyltransferase HpnI n=1 Tax=Rhodoplanes tepidamans TaxID=200616 RepID=A0ABT5JDE5_RHOTP|nr:MULTISPECIES: bacteriohopanetetrol glucosamine biosynthesis glycosyltransferase HpnI [Rhodoplanes]MDC7787711.1 bacteriohopanetetrol glucosamine biosynthesis glycosyltransferase HpnI [Rhodoplanes tepidamans]MDC7986607.1 bacteriohopanetetrol glucosamine biosynthesis glycosyltransferase HpnI [Rhodoplanes sp. TEM]MDQ0356467.1 ceramide glucosyltransferase [Rhodoplanes tepidamans]
MAIVLAILLMLLATAGCAYLAVAAVLVGRFAARPAPGVPEGEPAPGVTVLKPLHGAPPGLLDDLATLCRQRYPGPLQIVCGVADPADPAVAVVERLIASHPGIAIDLVIDPAVHGTNRKVSNLINMAAKIRHEVVVLSDADIRLRPDDLSRVVAALRQPGVGAVTCLYGGQGAAGVWSDLVALGLVSHFLPNAVLGLELGRAKPCFGALIALDRTTLDGLGGFRSFVDTLADDYAIGAAVRASGRRAVLVPSFAVVHRCDEASLAAAWSHELRWARTVMSLDPAGWAGAVVTHPLGFALLAAAFGGGRPALGLALAAIVGRAALAWRVGVAFALPVPALPLVPVRDLLTFAVFVASFLGRGVTWKDQDYRMRADGTFTEQDAPGRTIPGTAAKGESQT